MRALSGLNWPARGFLCPALALVVFSVAFSPNSQAQSIYGGLRGIVADPSGGALAQSKVTLIDEGTSNTRATLTSGAGEFSFASVVPSTYTVIAESPGFKKFERKGVVVGTQQFITVDVKMEV